MSIFNLFFDDRLNRLSKNRFFSDFLKFDFDLSIALKSKNRFLTQLLPYHVVTARAKSARCRQTFALKDFFLYEIQFWTTFIWTFFLKKYVFLVASSPKWNVICSFNNNNHNHINLSRALAPLCRETYAIGDLFVQNFTSNNFYSKRLFMPLPFCSISYSSSEKQIL